MFLALTPWQHFVFLQVKFFKEQFQVSKSQKRHRFEDQDISDHKAKILKRMDSERRQPSLVDEFANDEDVSQYMNDRTFYNAIKEYR